MVRSIVRFVLICTHFSQLKEASSTSRNGIVETMEVRITGFGSEPKLLQDSILPQSGPCAQCLDFCGVPPNPNSSCQRRVVRSRKNEKDTRLDSCWFTKLPEGSKLGPRAGSHATSPIKEEQGTRNSHCLGIRLLGNIGYYGYRDKNYPQNQAVDHNSRYFKHMLFVLVALLGVSQAQIKLGWAVFSLSVSL